MILHLSMTNAYLQYQSLQFIPRGNTWVNSSFFSLQFTFQSSLRNLFCSNKSYLYIKNNFAFNYTKFFFGVWGPKFIIFNEYVIFYKLKAHLLTDMWLQLHHKSSFFAGKSLLLVFPVCFIGHLVTVLCHILPS